MKEQEEIPTFIPKKRKNSGELYCQADNCQTVLDPKTIIYKKGRIHGEIICPECGHHTHVTKTAISEDLQRGPNGQLVRKSPKEKMTKKERKRRRIF
jgi:hypothetical protein